MGRPKKIDPPVRVEVKLPTSVYTRLQLELYSELEGRVPLGRMSDLATKLFSNWLDERTSQ